MAEQACSKMLANQRLAFDRSFTVLLKERQDVRDSRPLNLVGKFLTPSTSDSTASELCKKPWLVRKARAEEGEQLKGSDTLVLDDISEDTLPGATTGTDNSAHPNEVGSRGAKRWEQLGVDPCSKVLDAVLDNFEKIPSAGALLLFDAHVAAGDMLEALAIKKMGSRFPKQYFGVVGDASAKDSIIKARIENLAARVKAGLLTLAGVTYAAEMPRDLVEAVPPVPELQCTIWDSDARRLRIPPELLAKWGAQEDLQYEQGIETASSTNTKRDAGNVDLASPAKKMKLTDGAVFPMAKLEGSSVISVKLPMVKAGAELKILMGNKGIITSDTDVAVHIKKGTALLSFGKVTWRKLKEGDDKLLDRELPVSFTSSSDLITFAGKVCTMLEVVDAKRKT
jgi:hypothetical protein